MDMVKQYMSHHDFCVSWSNLECDCYKLQESELDHKSIIVSEPYEVKGEDINYGYNKIVEVNCLKGDTHYWTYSPYSFIQEICIKHN